MSRPSGIPIFKDSGYMYLEALRNYLFLPLGGGGGDVLDKTGKEEKFVKKKDFQKV